MRRITTMLLVSAPIVTLLAGCSGGGGTAAPTPAATPPSATSSIGAPSPSPTASLTSAASASASPGGNGGQAGGTPRCHTGDLKVSVAADPGGGAAGSSYESLVFKNSANHPCTLTGYPGVSFVAGDQGTQVNAPFARDPGQGRPTVRLLPGAAAHATLRIPNYQNFPADQCKPVSVRGFRVYPPDETASIFVSQPQKACSVKGIGVGDVRPITLSNS
jgi:Protein of unknown function (DUF4232)